jgi:hypothetical protein
LQRISAAIQAAFGPATRLIATSQSEHLPYLGKREAAILGMSDEVDTPRRIRVVQPVTGRAFARRLNETFLLIVAQRVVAEREAGSANRAAIAVAERIL